MKAVVAAFNQEKALVGAFSVITNLRMELFQALARTCCQNVVSVSRWVYPSIHRWIDYLILLCMSEALFALAGGINDYHVPD